jgi:DNA primase
VAGISDEKLQELRDRVDVAQVVARRVQLKRSGNDLRGLCPFHGEKTPSFYVVPDKRIYHCFGCGKTGDAIRFVMEMEGRSFREAVEQLATEFGVTLEADDPAERQRTARRAAIAEVNDKAATFYERVLWEHPRGKIARDHLEARSCSLETAKAWRLGYAPNLWDSLCKSLTRGKIDLQLAEEAGLVVPRKQGTGRGSHYDRFRGRLVIPIRESGRTVAFGGRLLEGESEAKYLNSPETALYQKGATLFGLDKAREAIRKEGVVLFVEGYFDAIGLHQAGVQTAVATCGTAMTDRHLELVTRAGAKELVFVFDGDTAGIRAATRASEIAAAAGISARVLVPPDGEDPDETVLRIGLEAFRGLLAAAAPSLEFLLDRALAAVGQGASIEARVRIVDSVAGIIRASPSPLARDLYIDKVAQKLGASADAVRMAVERSAELAGKPLPETPRPRLHAVQPGRGPQPQGRPQPGQQPGSAQGQPSQPKAEEPKPFVRPVPREVRLQEFSLVARMLQSEDHVKAADESGHIHAFLHAELRELAERAFAAAREGLFDGRALISTLEDEASRRELQQRFDEAALATSHGVAADPRFVETDRRGLLLALQKHARAAAEEEIRRRPKQSAVKPPPKPDQKTGA